MTPAELVLHKLDMQPVEFADAMDCKRTLWHQWMKRGGKIPSSAYKKILALSDKYDAGITANDLIFGGDCER